MSNNTSCEKHAGVGMLSGEGIRGMGIRGAWDTRGGTLRTRIEDMRSGPLGCLWPVLVLPGSLLSILSSGFVDALQKSLAAFFAFLGLLLVVFGCLLVVIGLVLVPISVSLVPFSSNLPALDFVGAPTKSIATLLIPLVCFLHVLGLLLVSFSFFWAPFGLLFGL